MSKSKIIPCADFTGYTLEKKLAHLSACAEYLAELATKFTVISDEKGTSQDVENNLNDILFLCEEIKK